MFRCHCPAMNAWLLVKFTKHKTRPFPCSDLLTLRHVIIEPPEQRGKIWIRLYIFCLLTIYTPVGIRRTISRSTSCQPLNRGPSPFLFEQKEERRRTLAVSKVKKPSHEQGFVVCWVLPFLQATRTASQHSKFVKLHNHYNNKWLSVTRLRNTMLTSKQCRGRRRRWWWCFLLW